MNHTSTSETRFETADAKPEWIDDGHQVTVTLDYGQFAFAVICPSDGVDLAGKPWIELPVCRRVLDEDGQPQLDESPASECYLARLGKEFTADEFFDSDVPVFEVVSPFAVEYRFEGWDSEAVYVRPKLAVDLGDEPVHGWFGLTYSSYQVLPRVLMQSMPPAWQRQMVALLEQLRDAFSHLDHAEGYDVQAAIEVEASSLTEAQRKATGVTEDWEGDEEDGEFVYHDANGDELESWSRVLVRVAGPLPPYNRGRTRIPLRESEPVEQVAGQGVLPVETAGSAL